jgi:hypothetical protein
VLVEADGRRTVAEADDALTARLLHGDAVGTTVRLAPGEGGPDVAGAPG